MEDAYAVAVEVVPAVMLVLELDLCSDVDVVALSVFDPLRKNFAMS